MPVDPYEFAEDLIDHWRSSDDDRSMSECLLLSSEEYIEYVREDYLPDDFIARHRMVEP